MKSVPETRRRPRSGRWALCIAGLVLIGCGDNVVDPGAAMLAVAGDGAILPAGCVVDVALQLADAEGASVTFQIAEGGGSIEPAEATPTQDGLVRARWVLGGGENRLTSVSSQDPDQPLTIAAQGIPTAPGGYATIGNKIFSSTTCKPHRFVGVARPGLEWNAWDQRLRNPDLAMAEFKGMQSWNANVVRIPLAQMYWVPTSIHHVPDYPDLVTRLVTQARSIGLDVIIDLHASDRGDPAYGGEFEGQQMADVAHSIPFWRDVATRFKNDGGVLFEVYNEPNAIDWNVWLNGGDIAGGAQYAEDINAAFKKPYRAAGMQQLYDAVRSVGANNLVIVGGTHWGFFLNQVPNHLVKGFNIAYATHPYNYADKLSPTWDDAFGKLAATHPVMITEFGVTDCSSTYLTEVMDYADKHQLSWLAWSWWSPAPGPGQEAERCRFTALLDTWEGQPNALGALIRNRLLSYRPSGPT